MCERLSTPLLLPQQLRDSSQVLVNEWICLLIRECEHFYKSRSFSSLLFWSIQVCVDTVPDRKHSIIRTYSSFSLLQIS